MSLRAQMSGSTPLDPGLRCVVVWIGPSPLAFDSDAVDGLLTADVAGNASMVIVHDVTYRPVDVAGRLSLQAAEDGPDTRVVLLTHGGRHGSVRVDRVEGIRDVERSRVVPVPPQFRGEEQTWYRSLLVFEETVALLLDTTWVLQGAEVPEGETRCDRSRGGPRVINVTHELVAGKVREC